MQTISSVTWTAKLDRLIKFSSSRSRVPKMQATSPFKQHATAYRIASQHPVTAFAGHVQQSWRPCALERGGAVGCTRIRKGLLGIDSRNRLLQQHARNGQTNASWPTRSPPYPAGNRSYQAWVESPGWT